MAISVSSLNAYVNEHSEPIIKNLIFGAPSIKLLSVMSDVKGDAALNILKTSVAFGDGSTCGWSDNSTATLSQRVLKTAPLKVNIAYCQRALTKYWAGQELNQKIGIEVMPFEEKFVNDVITDVSRQIETMIYYGDSSTSGSIEFDGLWTIAAADAAETNPVVNVVTATSALDAALYSKLQAVVAAIPSNVYDKNIVVMSLTTFRGVLADYESTHPYQLINFIDDSKTSFYMPNSNVRVYGVAGMETSGTANTNMLSFNPETAFFGCDYEDAATTYDFDYNKHEQQFEMQMLLNAGVQFAFLDEVVIAATYSA